MKRELSRQAAVRKIREKFGMNAILKGMNFEEGATAIERNSQIGGHRAGRGETAAKPSEGAQSGDGEKAG